MAVYGNRSLGPQVFNVLITLFLFFVCLFFACLLFFVFVFVFLLLLLFFVSCAFPPPRSNPTSGKIKRVTFCCVTQTKKACELSVRNYRFETLQRIQKRRLIGENCSNDTKLFVVFDSFLESHYRLQSRLSLTSPDVLTTLSAFSTFCL